MLCHSVLISSYGKTIAVCDPYNDGNGTKYGHLQIYAHNGNSGVKVGYYIDGKNTLNMSRNSIFIICDGNTVAVHDYGEYINCSYSEYMLFYVHIGNS